MDILSPATEELIGRVRRFLDRPDLPERQRLLIALSGGMDSVVLTHVLCRLAGERGLILCAAHLHHGMRSEADGDAEFVRAFCRDMGIPCIAGRADVPTLAAQTGLSPEMAARDARHAFLEEARVQSGSGGTVLAHHMRDQAETVLLRLGRGSSAEGLGGMRPVSGRLLRPLLDVPWDMLRAYAAENALSWREDVTNADTSVPRNAVRHRVIPALEAVYPGAQESMARASRLLQRDDDCLRQMARGLLEGLRPLCGGGCALPAAPVAHAHPALGSRAVLMALREGGYPGALTEAHVEAVLELARGRTGAGCDLPGGWRAERDSRDLAFFPAEGRGCPGEIPLPRRDADLHMGGRTVAVRTGADAALPGQVMDAACIPPAAVLRGRRRGDRMQPLGMAGMRKLKDILIDDKIPARERDSLILLADGPRVLHILGTGRIDESVKVSRNTREYIAITMKDHEVER